MKNFKSLILIGAILLVSSIFNTTYADYSCDQTQDFSFKLREGVNYRLHDYAYNLGSTDFVINGAYMAGLASSNFDSLGTPYTLNAGSRDVMYFKSKGYDNNQGLSFSQSTFGKSFNWWIILDGKYVGTNTAIRLCENVKFDITKCGDGNLDKNTDGYLGGQGSWTSEQCDDGSANSNTTPGSCKLDCSGRVPQNDPKYDIYQCQDNGNWSKTASSVTQTQGSSYNSNQNYDRTSVVWVNEGASAPNDATCKDPTTPVNGVCSQTEVGKCIVGTASNDNNNNSCSEIRTWKCESSNNGTTADCSHANAACGCTPNNSNAVNVCSDTTFINNCKETIQGTKSCGTTPNYPAWECGTNGWFKLGWNWPGVNYDASKTYKLGEQASLEPGTTPNNAICNPAPTKPVRQCTTNGWIKTTKKWDWANYDANRAYQLNDEASLNEGETPKNLTCGPTSYTKMHLTKTANKTTVVSGDLVTYTITMHNDGPGVITASRIEDILPDGMKFVSSDRGHHVVDKNGYHVRNDVGFKREVLADGQWYYKGAYDGDGPTNIVCSTEGKATITDPKDLFYPGKQLCYHTNTYDWWLSYGVNDYRSWGPGGSSQDEWMRRQYLPGDTIIWFWGDIEAGGSRTFTITARYDGSKDAQCMVNTATGGMDTPEYPRNAADDSASATVCAGVQPTVDVQITKAVDKTGFINNTGEIITWTLNYQNNGPATATGVVVSDIIPKQLTYLMGSVDGSKYTFTATPTASGTTQLIWIFKQPLAAGATGSFTVTTQYRGGHPDGQPIINATAIVATNDSDPTNNTDTETTKPYSSPVLGSLGDRVWIDADKDGVQDADEVSLSGVKVDLLTCTGTVLATTTTNGSGFYLFTGLTAGNYKVRFTIPTGYVWTSKGTGTTTDSDVNVDGSTDCIVLGAGEHRRDIDAGVVFGSISQADVQITKTVDRSRFPNNTGEVITWTLNYKNNGPAVATGVVVRDLLPQGLDYTSSVPIATIVTPDRRIGTPCVLGQINRHCQSSYLSWNIGTLQPGQTGTIIVTSRYGGGVANGSGMINNTDITTITPETNYNNNTGSAITTPYSSGVTDVEISKSVNKASFPNTSGELVTWTLVYKNNGPTAVTNAVITDELPSSMMFVSAAPAPNMTGTMMYFVPGVRYGCFPSPTNPTQTVCGDPGPIYNGVRWNIGNLAVGQTGSITLTTKYLGGVANGSGIVNKVSITVAETETRYDNNSGSAVTTPYSSGTIGTASLGNYVWIDADKDGVQDANEVVLSGVKVDLYKISSCTADLSGVLMTTTTNASGFYLFTGLDAGSYKVKFTLPNGYEFTMPNQGSDDAVDSDAGLNGVTSCIELQQGENNMTVDAGVVLNQPISCEGLTLSTTSMSVGGTVNYTCSHKNATSAVVTVTSSGSMTGVVSVTGFTGQFTISQAGVYNVQCTLDNSITYKVVSYAASGSAITCAYKAQANNVNMCAMKTSLDPYLTSGVNLSGLIYMPTPYPYCTDAQIADTSYACVAAPAGSQILTRQDNMCRAQLTVTAGGGGCTSNCGGSTYNFCGDGAINNNSEQCDDGNRVNGDGCNSSCQREGSTPTTPPSPTKPNNAIKVKTGSSLLCESIDPPSVNSGEYLPFWWSMEYDNDVKIVSDCSQSENGKTNIINGSDAQDNPICHFEMRNGLGETSQFSRSCFEKTDLKQYPLFQSFFSARSRSDSDYSDIYNNSSAWGGTSYFGPSNWGNANFTALGEYSLSLYKTTFKQCKGVASGSAIIWSEDPTRYESKNDAGFDRACSFNFTVTRPYFVQDGVSLSTTPLDASIIESFRGFTTANQIVSNIKENSSYNGNSNLVYLEKAFVEKYKKLATSDKAPNGVSLPAGFTKVPGKDIYVYTRPTNLSGGPLTVQPIDRNTPIHGTLISTDTDLVINGDVNGIAMIIAPNNTIDFRTTESEYNKVQLINGIYIANKITSSTKIFNGSLGNATWASQGGIRLKGVMISANAKDDIRQLVLSRRSYLGTWFDTDRPGFDESHKRRAILDGAAFTIETDPSFWTSLPPGANELMSALETYK